MGFLNAQACTFLMQADPKQGGMRLEARAYTEQFSIHSFQGFLATTSGVHQLLKPYVGCGILRQSSRRIR